MIKKLAFLLLGVSLSVNAFAINPPQTYTVTHNLTSQIPSLVPVFTEGQQGISNLNYPINVPKFNPSVGTLLSAHINSTWNSVWLSKVENMNNNLPAIGYIADRAFVWFTERPSDSVLPRYDNRVAGGGSTYWYWNFNLSPYDGVLDFNGASGETLNSMPYPNTTISYPLEWHQIQRCIGVGTRTIYFHPSSDRQPANDLSQLPPGHWGVMRTTSDLRMINVSITYTYSIP